MTLVRLRLLFLLVFFVVNSCAAENFLVCRQHLVESAVSEILKHTAPQYPNSTTTGIDETTFYNITRDLGLLNSSGGNLTMDKTNVTNLASAVAIDYYTCVHSCNSTREAGVTFLSVSCFLT